MLAYLWNVWAAVRRWYGTEKRPRVSSATGVGRSGERQDVSRRSDLEAFLGWLMGTMNQSSLTSFGTARSLRRRTAWCWNVAPRITMTGEVHDQIQVDGIYVGSWCCLIVRSRLAASSGKRSWFDDLRAPEGFCWITLSADVAGPVIPRARHLSIRMIEQNPTVERK